MSRRLRFTLFFIGLSVFLAGLGVLVVLSLPGETVTEQATLVPTLFVAP